MRTFLIVLMALHFAVCPLAYCILALVLIVGLAAGELTAWVLLPYGSAVAITLLIIKYDYEIASSADE